MDKACWNMLSLEHAVEIQRRLRDKVVQTGEKKADDFHYVAGVDLAYWNEQDGEYAVCCIVVLEQETKRVAESKFSFGKIEVPYIPGCLAFRELPLVLETVEKLELSPDLYMFDGNGYLHPRRMGIATHVSFYLNRPTIGVAKTYYAFADETCMAGKEDKAEGAGKARNPGKTEFIMPDNEENAYTDIVISGEVCGRALRTVRNVKPVFVSVGNYIDLDTAAEMVCRFITHESHIPLPTRLADIETHRRREEMRRRNSFDELLNEIITGD